VHIGTSQPPADVPPIPYKGSGAKLFIQPSDIHKWRIRRRIKDMTDFMGKRIINKKRVPSLRFPTSPAGKPPQPKDKLLQFGIFCAK
jgi:hypothetical protein